MAHVAINVPYGDSKPTLLYIMRVCPEPNVAESDDAHHLPA